MSWKPFFASSKLVKDYEPLKIYLEKVKGTEWYDKGFISQNDFEKLKEILSKKKKHKLGDLWDELTKYFEDRIDGKAALEALREAGYEVENEEEAKKKLSEILAGWLLEAGEEWGFFKFPENA